MELVTPILGAQPALALLRQLWAIDAAKVVRLGSFQVN
jgi:hypothetical protein